jgi:hypothetical protein
MACIIALVALGVELYLGTMAARDGSFSWGVFLVACIATVAVCSFALLALLMWLMMVISLTNWEGVTVEATWCFGAIWVGAGCAVLASWTWPHPKAG